jgi:hypothetical protein
MNLAVAAAFADTYRLRLRPPFSPLAQRWIFTWLLSSATCPERLRAYRDGGKYVLPNHSLTPTREAIVDRFVRAILRRAVLPAASRLLHVHDPAQNPPIIVAFRTLLVGPQLRLHSTTAHR